MKPGLGIVLLALIGFGIGTEVYMYKDCKNVGHSTAYCVLRIG